MKHRTLKRAVRAHARACARGDEPAQLSQRRCELRRVVEDEVPLSANATCVDDSLDLWRHRWRVGLVSVVHGDLAAHDDAAAFADLLDDGVRDKSAHVVKVDGRHVGAP